MTREVISAHTTEMEKLEPITIVSHCIDFRKVEDTKNSLAKEYQLADGEYYLLATAGGAYNDQALERLGISNGNPKPVKTLINFNHEDCGFAKSKGDDSEVTHHNKMTAMGLGLKLLQNTAEYKYDLLPASEQERSKHTCEATAIILGQPEIVKAARQKLSGLELTDNHDEIARPFKLDVEDSSIWEDLEISLRLHNPSKILIFEQSEENAKRLVEKVKEIAHDKDIQSVIISKVA